METADHGRPYRQWSSYVALVLACVAIVLSLGPYVLLDRVSYPGVPFIRLLDSDTGEPTGFIQAEYGGITFARTEHPSNNKRTQLLFRPDGSVVIEIWDGTHIAAKWSLTEDGAKFEKSPE